MDAIGDLEVHNVVKIQIDLHWDAFQQAANSKCEISSIHLF